MADYRRNFIPGGSFFFTVNLTDRRSRLLVEQIDHLRNAFRYARARHAFTTDAVVILPDHLHAIWTLPQRDNRSKKINSERDGLAKEGFVRNTPIGDILMEGKYKNHQ